MCGGLIYNKNALEDIVQFVTDMEAYVAYVSCGILETKDFEDLATHLMHYGNAMNPSECYSSFYNAIAVSKFIDRSYKINLISREQYDRIYDFLKFLETSKLISSYRDFYKFILLVNKKTTSDIEEFYKVFENKTKLFINDYLEMDFKISDVGKVVALQSLYKDLVNDGYGEVPACKANIMLTIDSEYFQDAKDGWIVKMYETISTSLSRIKKEHGICLKEVCNIHIEEGSILNPFLYENLFSIKNNLELLDDFISKVIKQIPKGA